MFQLSEKHELRDIHVEVTIWLNLIADDGPYGECNALKPIMQLHNNLWDAWFYIMDSVSNGSKWLVQFRVRVGTGTEPLQRVLPLKNPDHCNWAGFTTTNPAFQTHNFDSNGVSEFWLYRDMINM